MLQGGGSLAAASGLAWPALGQGTEALPVSPLTIVVPFAPGALNDLLTRTLAQELGRRMGSPVVAVNRPGAAAQIGTDFVARAAPDGYTLLMGSNGPLAELPVLKAGVPYRVPEDFTFVSRISANNPWLIASSTRFAAKTLPELVAYARANPGAVRYGSIGVGSGGQLAMATARGGDGGRVHPCALRRCRAGRDRSARREHRCRPDRHRDHAALCRTPTVSACSR